MGDLSIPAGPHELTPDWLMKALRSTGAIRKAKVTSLDVEPNIAAGTGFMGQLARVTPHYDAPEEGAPSSLIAKFPTPAPENRAVAERYRFYEVETSFYREVARRAALRTPRCYYNAYDPKTAGFVLLLEDLASLRSGDQVAGCSIAQAELALRELAKFHASWWQQPELARLSWMPYANDTTRAALAQENYQAAWPPFVEGFGKMVPPEVLKLGEQLGDKVVAVLDGIAEPPRTIVHGDYRLDNLFFGASDSELTVIDWQILSRGRGLFDVAYFMTGSLQPAQRKAKEVDLLHMYHNVLLEHGIKGYDFDQLLHDYRLSILFCWLYVVIVLGALDVATDRGLELFTGNLERGIAAIQDLKAGELLPA